MQKVRFNFIEKRWPTEALGAAGEASPGVILAECDLFDREEDRVDVFVAVQ